MENRKEVNKMLFLVSNTLRLLLIIYIHLTLNLVNLVS